MRFLREIMLAVRAEVGTDYPVGMRVGASTGEGGLGEEELNTVIRTLRSEDMVDFLDVSWSDYYNFKFVAAMYQPVGYQLPSRQQITAATLDIPRFVIGRIRTLEEAEQILRDWVADKIGRSHVSTQFTNAHLVCRL